VANLLGTTNHTTFRRPTFALAGRLCELWAPFWAPVATCTTGSALFPAPGVHSAHPEAEYPPANPVSARGWRVLRSPLFKAPSDVVRVGRKTSGHPGYRPPRAQQQGSGAENG